MTDAGWRGDPLPAGRRRTGRAGTLGREGRGGMRGGRLLLAVVSLALVQGCAASDPDGGGAGREAGRQAQRYQTTAGVLESPKHGPELCLGGVKMSYPPQCEG